MKRTWYWKVVLYEIFSAQILNFVSRYREEVIYLKINQKFHGSRVVHNLGSFMESFFFWSNKQEWYYKVFINLHFCFWTKSLWKMLPKKAHRELKGFVCILQMSDLVKFVMCTQVSRDCVPFCKYKKRHVNPGNQSTYDKLNQIR